jgi:hypothetical protein
MDRLIYRLDIDGTPSLKEPRSNFQYCIHRIFLPAQGGEVRYLCQCGLRLYYFPHRPSQRSMRADLNQYIYGTDVLALSRCPAFGLGAHF